MFSAGRQLLHKKTFLCYQVRKIVPTAGQFALCIAPIGVLNTFGGNL